MHSKNKIIKVTDYTIEVIEPCPLNLGIFFKKKLIVSGFVNEDDAIKKVWELNGSDPDTHFYKIGTKCCYIPIQ